MNVSLDESGNVKVDQRIPFAYPYTNDFSTGTEVPLEAVPAPGYRFSNWSGDLSGTDNPAAVVMSCTKRITAIFSRITHTLTIRVVGDGSINLTAGTHDYAEGEVVSLAATADEGWQFVSWTGDVTEPSSATTKVTIDSGKTVTATFYENGGHDLAPATTRVETFKRTAPAIMQELTSPGPDDFALGGTISIPCADRTLKIDWSRPPDSFDLFTFE